MKLVRKFWPFFLFILILFLATRKFLFTDGYILYGEYFSTVDYIFYLKDFLKAWSDNTSLGHSNIGFPTTYGLNPVFFINSPGFVTSWLSLMSILQLLFGHFTSKIYLLIAVALPFLGMYFLARNWFKQAKGISILSGLIYLTSGQIIDRIYAGHIHYVFGYGLLPILLLFIFKTIEERNNNLKKLYLLSSGLTGSLLFWYMPHLFTFVAIILFFYFIFFIIPASWQRKKNFFITSIVLISLAILLNIHAWLPAIFFPERYPFLKNLTYSFQSVYYSSQRANIKDILSLGSGSQEIIYSSDFFKNLKMYRFIFPILSFLVLIFYKDRKKSLFAFSIALSGLVLSLGTNSPIGELFALAYKNTPFFSIFRDISKFAALYAFGISLSAPLFLSFIQKINERIYLFLFSLSVGFILFINPIFISGNFGKIMIPFNPPQKYFQIKEFLSKMRDDFRVAIYPNDRSFGEYVWYKKLGISNGSPNYSIFTTLFPIDKNIAVSNRTLRDFGSRYLDYLETNIDKDWAADRLGETNVRFIIIDHDLDGFEQVLTMAKKNVALKELPTADGFSLFEVKNYQNGYLRKRNAFYFYGNMSALEKIPSNLALIDLSNNSTSALSQNLSNIILLYKTSVDDIFFDTLKDYRFSFFPQVQQNIEGFLPSADNIRDLSLRGINTYNPESIFTGGITSISKQINLNPGNYRVFMSVLTNQSNTLTDSVAIKIGDRYLEKRGFKKNYESFIWLDFGRIKISSKKDTLALKNLENKYLIIDSILLIPEEKYDKKLADFQSILKSKSIIDLDKDLNLSDLKLKSDLIYVFSKNYSPYWNLCNSQTFIVNFHEIGSKCKMNPLVQTKFTPSTIYTALLILSFLINSVIIIWITKLLIAFSRDKTH